ncbi:MAG: VOC family protein [Planctomycetes bacterium]|nr:VOC family protein [Planctomycetota bacterium]
MAQWYDEVLGYEKFFRNDNPVWIMRAPDGSLLEIMPHNNLPRPERVTTSPGLSHLALRVSNLDDAIAYLDSKKVEWISDAFDAIGGGRLRNFNDPEGNMLQIVERES